MTLYGTYISFSQSSFLNHSRYFRCCAINRSIFHFLDFDNVHTRSATEFERIVEEKKKKKEQEEEEGKEEEEKTFPLLNES